MCTRILWNTNHLAVVAARTMDWPESTEPMLTAFPRGMTRDGGKLGHQPADIENPHRWTSKYGSLVTTVYEMGAADGMNERGLTVHMLYLKSTDFGPRDLAKPAIHAGLWAQYLLDSAATVEEALGLLDGVQIVMATARGRDATVHLALEDASGDSAIVEFDQGRPQVHHDRRYVVMTNDPPYDEQLKLLAQHDFSHPASDLPLPGNVNAVDRFQRASYFAALLPPPKNLREAMAGVLAIARNASVPFGAPYHGFGIYNTEYRTAADLTDRWYFFELSTSPNLMWVELDRLDLTEGSPVRRLNPDDLRLAGEVSGQFTPADSPY